MYKTKIILWIIIILSNSGCLISQNYINIINKNVKISQRSTKFNFTRVSFSPCYNRYFKIKINGEILKDSIKIEVVDNFIKTNYDIKILNGNNENICMKNYCRGQRENYRDATLLNKDAVLANIEKIREQEKSYKNSLIKHKKNYIEIKVPTRERTLHGISSSYYGYGLERGKYLIVLSYTNDGLTYYSDTIPLFVR